MRFTKELCCLREPFQSITGIDAACRAVALARSVRWFLHAAAAPAIVGVVPDLVAVCAGEHVNVGMPLTAGVDESVVLGPARIRPVHIELCSTAVVISRVVERSSFLRQLDSSALCVYELP